MRQLCLLSAGAFLLSSSVFAQDSGPFSNAPAPTQEYHAATANIASVPVSHTVSQADLVGGASVPVAPVNSAPVAAVAPAAQPTVVVAAPAPAGNATLNSAGIDTGVQGQLSQLTQSTLTFEQQADQRIQNLVDSNQAIGTTLRTMTQNISMLQQQMSQIPSASSASASASFYGVTLNQEELNGIMIGAGGMLLLMLGVLFGRYTQQRARVTVSSRMPSAAKEQEAEYDFMGTPEAIPAKLDLARSYIAMNDIDQAKTILKTVIERGNDLERAEAGVLFQKIIKKNND